MGLRLGEQEVSGWKQVVVGVGDRAGIVVVCGFSKVGKECVVCKETSVQLSLTYRSQGDQGSVSKFNNVRRA